MRDWIHFALAKIFPGPEAKQPTPDASSQLLRETKRSSAVPLDRPAPPPAPEVAHRWAGIDYDEDRIATLFLESQEMIDQGIVPPLLAGFRERMARTPSPQSEKRTVIPASPSAPESTPTPKEARRFPRLDADAEKRILAEFRAIRAAGELQSIDQFPPIAKDAVYDPKLAGVLCGFNDTSGRFRLIHGHHRQTLAQKHNIQDLKFRIVNVTSMVEGRVLNGVLNIAEGRYNSEPEWLTVFARETGITAARWNDECIEIPAAVLKCSDLLRRLNADVFQAVLDRKIERDRAVQLVGLKADEQKKRLAMLIQEKQTRSQSVEVPPKASDVSKPAVAKCQRENAPSASALGFADTSIASGDPDARPLLHTDATHWCKHPWSELQAEGNCVRCAFCGDSWNGDGIEVVFNTAAIELSALHRRLGFLQDVIENSLAVWACTVCGACFPKAENTRGYVYYDYHICRDCLPDWWERVGDKREEPDRGYMRHGIARWLITNWFLTTANLKLYKALEAEILVAQRKAGKAKYNLQ